MHSRPNQLIPSWEDHHQSVTNYNDFDIEVDIKKIRNNPQSESSTVTHPVEPNIDNPPTQTEETEPIFSVDDLFSVDEEEEKRIEKLLKETFAKQSTSQPTSSRYLRSSNLSLSWSRKMNDGPVVLLENTD